MSRPPRLTDDARLSPPVHMRKYEPYPRRPFPPEDHDPEPGPLLVVITVAYAALIGLGAGLAIAYLS